MKSLKKKFGKGVAMQPVDTLSAINIPVHLRIGVTGSRDLGDAEGVGAAVDRVLESLRSRMDPTGQLPPKFTVVSPLAEGADRIVASRVLRQDDSDLLVPLPFGLDEYKSTFSQQGSDQEFDALAERGRLIFPIEMAGSQEAAFLQLGQYVVEQCDVLIAVWDGATAKGTGGTGDVVKMARDSRTPHFWINTNSNNLISEKWTKEIESDWLSFNAEQLSETDLDKSNTTTLLRALKSVFNQPEGDNSDSSIEKMLLNRFRRCDVLSTAHQRRFFLAILMVFTASALAVTVSAMQVIFFPHSLLPTVLEIGLILGILFTWGVGVRRRFHARWVSYRLLAERLRSFFFFHMVGAGAKYESVDRMYKRNSPSWTMKAFHAIKRDLCSWDCPEKIGVEKAKSIIVRDLVEDQISYHTAKSTMHAKRHKKLSRLSVCLFFATLLCVLLHLVLHSLDVEPMDVYVPYTLSNMLAFLSIFLPSCGSAVAAIEMNFNFHQNSNRSNRMIDRLTRRGAELSRASTHEELVECLTRLDETLLSEVYDWHEAIRFRQIKPG